MQTVFIGRAGGRDQAGKRPSGLGVKGSSVGSLSCHGQGCESHHGQSLKMSFRNWSEGYAGPLPHPPVARLLAGDGR